MSESQRKEYVGLLADLTPLKQLYEVKVAEVQNLICLGRTQQTEVSRMEAHALLDEYLDKYARAVVLGKQIGAIDAGK